MIIKKQAELFDFSVTTLENIFLDEFMPRAPEHALKVYLMCQRLLQKTSSFQLRDLEKALSLSEEEIRAAFQYWQDQGIIRYEPNASIPDVTFLSLRSFYIENNFERKLANTSVQLNSYFLEIFKAVDQTITIPLTEHERSSLADFLKNKSIDKDVIAMAFEESRHAYLRAQKAIQKLRYWLENGVQTTSDVFQLKERLNLRALQYKKVLSALGYPYDQPTAGDKECIDRWLDEYNLSIDDIIDKITEITKKKRNAPMSYIDAAFRNDNTGNKKPKEDEEDLKNLFRFGSH